MNVLYCGDRNILDGLIISTLSLAKKHKDEFEYFRDDDEDARL